jgi:glycosyltransferase involved in cell wall biosynthesis
VSETLPRVTILIAARPGQSKIKAVTATRQLDYPPDRLEIILARGKQPSVQRNAALKAASGEVIYFLDDDSEPPPDGLRRAVVHFTDTKVKMVGGPNLCPPDAPKLEQVFAVVLSSWLAFGPSRARYAAVGSLREASEKELILCNLLALREALLEPGGFNEALYPNEENALMDELQKRGGKLLYDPQLVVQRRPRHNLRAFAKMLLNYGRGRAEQFRSYPTFGSALNFVPPLFCLYLALLPVLMKLLPRGFTFENISLSSSGEESHQTFSVDINLALLPLVGYVVALLFQTLVSAFRHGIIKSVLALPLLALTHIFYGLGFWHGLFTRLRAGDQKPSTEVTLEKIQP